MGSSNYTYNGKLWRLCSTTSDSNSFFHSAFGERASDGEGYFDNDVRFHRMRWATFLTYFEKRPMPPLLVDILKECLSTNNKYCHVSVEDKQNFAKYISDLMADERAVTKEEIPILATLENTTITLLLDKKADSVFIVRPNPEILGSYRNALEKPKEVVLCLEENIFTRLECIKENSKPKSIKVKSGKKTDPNKYKKGGSAGSKGVEYQISLTALVMLNALKNGLGEWKLSTENEDAGKFDDVVLECSAGDILIQSKHKENKNRITLEDLISTNSKSDNFSIPKYFLSYQLIKTKFKIKNIIICTNADVHGKVLKFLDRRETSSESVLYCEDGDYSIYTFNDTFLPDLKENAERYYLQNFKNKNVEDLVITDEDLKDFLKHLQLYFRYPSRNYLEKNIDKLLSTLKCCSNSHDKIFSSEVYPKVMDWFQQKDGTYLAEIHAKAIFSEIWRDKYCQQIEQYEVSFQKNDFSFQGSKQLFHVTCGSGHLLQVIKIYRAIQDNKTNILFVNSNDEVEVQKQIVQTFELPQYTFLIIIWSKTVEKSITVAIYENLKDLLKERKYKKIIFVTENNSEPASQIGFGECIQLDGYIMFEDLSKNTQERLLTNENIDFQGRITSLEKLFASQSIEDYGKSFDSAILEEIIRGENVKVGAPFLGLHVDTASCYINRVFQKETTQVENEEYSNETTKNSFSEEDLYRATERIILIGDGPGMGKTTVLTKLATVLKEEKPDLWVIRINLNEYTRILRDSLNKRMKTISILELLNSEERTQLSNQIERYVFSIRDKVVLLIDGVDEISPHYTDLILPLLIECQQASNFVQIFITTRPHLIKTIETVLEVTSYKMYPFMIQDQTDFLTKFWRHNLQLEDKTRQEKCAQYANILVDKVSSWVKSYNYLINPIAAIPLQVKMLAEIFVENNSIDDSVDWEGCKEYLQGDRLEPNLPEKFNMAELYDIFIRKKRDLFIDKGSSSGNTAANQALMDKFEESLAHHRALALTTILNKNQSDLFSSCYPGEKNMETYVLKMGIVERSGGKLQFVHRTFAEYFVAQSILRELEFQDSNLGFQIFLIDEILLESEFSVVRAFLDNFLRKFVDSLPSSIFKKYQSSTCKSNYARIMFVLSEEGCVAILQMILKNIDFKIIRKIGFADTFNVIFKKTNTLNDIRIMMQTSGVNILNGRGNMPLHHAALGGHLEMVKFLIRHGAFINSRGRAGSTALHFAARLGYLDIVKYLVQNGADINSKDANGCTVLHAATGSAKLDTVKYLVECGADTNFRDNKGSTILYAAVKSGNRELIKYFVKLGVNIDNRDNDGGTVLHSAIWFDNLDGVKHLVELGADINTRDGNGDTVLHSVARFGNLKTFKFLVNLGADIQSRKRHGASVLHLAAASGNADTVKYLVELGLDTNSTDNFGRTALYSAVESGDLNTVRYLVEHGLDVNVKDKSGSTALHIASENSNLVVVKYLVDCDADINVKDDNGRTVLHSAAKSGDLDSVKYLKECGVDIGVRDSNGCTASQLAADWNKWNVVRYFQEISDFNTTNWGRWYTKFFNK